MKNLIKVVVPKFENGSFTMEERIYGDIDVAHHRLREEFGGNPTYRCVQQETWWGSKPTGFIVTFEKDGEKFNLSTEIIGVLENKVADREVIRDSSYASRLATVNIKLPTRLCKILGITSARCTNCETQGGHYGGHCVGI